MGLAGTIVEVDQVERGARSNGYRLRKAELQPGYRSGYNEVAGVQVEVGLFLELTVTENVLEGQVFAELPSGGVDDLPLLELDEGVGEIGFHIQLAVAPLGLTIKLITGGHGDHAGQVDCIPGVGRHAAITVDDARGETVGIRIAAVEYGVVFQVGRDLPHSAGSKRRVI